jgi:hypothetical protein
MGAYPAMTGVRGGRAHSSSSSVSRTLEVTIGGDFSFALSLSCEFFA